MSLQTICPLVGALFQWEHSILIHIGVIFKLHAFHEDVGRFHLLFFLDKSSENKSQTSLQVKHGCDENALSALKLGIQ